MASSIGRIQFMDDDIKAGHYARKQLLHPLALIRWSHQSRFRHALELMGDLSRQDLLDFGCGDGTFLALLSEGERRPRRAVGAELQTSTVEDNRARLGQRSGVEFCLQSELEQGSIQSCYDVITCMEVLEHVMDTAYYLQLFHQWLRPGGRLLISVPVEIGPAVVVKQAARRIAGWMGAGDYPGVSPYTWPDLLRSVGSPSRQHMARTVHRDGSGFESHCHKGFNWKVLRSEMESLFTLQRIRTSPMRWLPPGCNSQVWLDARKGA